MIHQKLMDLTTDKRFRHRVEAAIVDIERLGEFPKIYETIRTVAQQREKVRLGYSKTMKSQHLDRGIDNLGCAADIADRVRGWNASRRFWLILGASCQARGLGWGGLFGLKRSQVKVLLQAFEVLRAAGWPETHPAYQTPIGWDPAHVQIRDNWSSWIKQLLEALK